LHFKGVPLKIEAMWTDDDGFGRSYEPVDITPFENKTFLAQ